MPKWSEGWQCRFKSRYAHRKQKMLDEMTRKSGGGSSSNYSYDDGGECLSPSLCGDGGFHW
jgi:hypothetical protein